MLIFKSILPFPQIFLHQNYWHKIEASIENVSFPVALLFSIGITSAGHFAVTAQCTFRHLSFACFMLGASQSPLKTMSLLQQEVSNVPGTSSLPFLIQTDKAASHLTPTMRPRLLLLPGITSLTLCFVLSWQAAEAQRFAVGCKELKDMKVPGEKLRLTGTVRALKLGINQGTSQCQYSQKHYNELEVQREGKNRTKYRITRGSYFNP